MNLSLSLSGIDFQKVGQGRTSHGGLGKAATPKTRNFWAKTPHLSNKGKWSSHGLNKDYIFREKYPKKQTEKSIQIKPNINQN